MSSYAESNYRWYILALGTGTHILVASLPRMSMPVLFEEISRDLGLDLFQVGVIWGIVSLGTILFAFGGGLVSDKYGISKTLATACLLQGIFGALRGVSGGFTSLAIYMFLFGLVGIPMVVATHKAAGEWFSGRQLGLANGILAMGMGVGGALGSMTSATVLSPLFGGWRNLMFIFGAISVVIALLWFKVRRRPGQSGTMPAIEMVPFRQALTRVIRIRVVWLMMLAQMFASGSRIGLSGYLPLYLRSVGWTPVGADGALAVMSIAAVLGVIPLSLLSDRIGSRKKVIIPGIIITIAGFAPLAFVTGGEVWLSVAMIGIVQEAVSALLITMVMETEGVGVAYSGTALGLTTTFAGIGGLFSPPIGNGLAETNTAFAFIFWTALVAGQLAIFSFVKETGWRKKGK